MRSVEGVFVPVTTPFRGEDVAVERLQANLRRWSATGLAGYVVLGSTGEFPMLSGADTVAKIAEHPNVVGIKDSSGNIPQAAQIIDQTPKSFHVLVGSASALLPSLAIGSSGGILALGLIAAREFCHVYAAEFARRD